LKIANKLSLNLTQL